MREQLQALHDLMWKQVKRLGSKSSPYESQQIAAELNTCCVALSHAIKAGDKTVALAWLDADGREAYLTECYKRWGQPGDLLHGRITVYKAFRKKLQEIAQ